MEHSSVRGRGPGSGQDGLDARLAQGVQGPRPAGVRAAVFGGVVGDEAVHGVKGATLLNARTPSLVASATATVRAARASPACLTAASSSENSDQP